MNLLILFAILSTFSARLWAEDDYKPGHRHHHRDSENAVLAADEDEGMKLSEAATKTLGVKTTEVTGRSPYTFAASAIVRFKDETGVYRLRQGFFKLIEGDATRSAKGVTFKPHRPNDIVAGDHIVVEGVPLLRVAELDAFRGEAGGHAH